MTFTPYHDKIELRPFKTERVIADATQKFHEMGEVVAVGKSVTFVQPGDTVIFVAHGIWETPEIEGEKHYVVSEHSEYILGKIESVGK